MAKKQIRLQYSGFIVFAATILSTATGLIFQLVTACTTTKPGIRNTFFIIDIIAINN